MEIDDRLNRLTERHEVLAESIQLLIGTVDANAAQLATVVSTVAALAEGIRGLVTVAESHEKRISDLEQ